MFSRRRYANVISRGIAIDTHVRFVNVLDGWPNRVGRGYEGRWSNCIRESSGENLHYRLIYIRITLTRDRYRDNIFLETVKRPTCLQQRRVRKLPGSKDEKKNEGKWLQRALRGHARRRKVQSEEVLFLIRNVPRRYPSLSIRTNASRWKPGSELVFGGGSDGVRSPVHVGYVHTALLVCRRRRHRRSGMLYILSCSGGSPRGRPVGPPRLFADK